MANTLATKSEPAPFTAITVSRDVQEFDLLIEDMEATLGESWGDLGFAEAIAYLRQGEARMLEFVVLAADHRDEPRLPEIIEVIQSAKRAGLRVILVADGLGPIVLHEMLRAGADDFVPYPLPEKALSQAIARVRNSRVGTSAPVPRIQDAEPPELPNVRTPSRPPDGKSALIAVQGLAGGVGATTFAVNLAAELAHLSGPKESVCLIDLGLQFGTVATYLDLLRKEAIFEMLTDAASMDEEAFRQALAPHPAGLQVFTAPADILPLDLIGPEDLGALLALARRCFATVIVDMPPAVTQWTESVLREADVFYALCELEMRSAQNALRFLRLLRGEDVPSEGIAFVLNRAPRRIDLSARGRVDKMAESLGISFRHLLPDGGRQITETNDLAQPLREGAPRNPLTQEIARAAATLRAAGRGDAAPRRSGRLNVFGLKFG